MSFYEPLTLTDMQKNAWQHAEDKGFHKHHITVGDRLALIHSEVSEALEAYRERGLADWTSGKGKPEGLASELADVIIRIGDMAGVYGIDINEEVCKKMEYNTTRSYMHGGKKL